MEDATLLLLYSLMCVCMFVCFSSSCFGLLGHLKFVCNNVATCICHSMDDMEIIYDLCLLLFYVSQFSYISGHLHFSVIALYFEHKCPAMEPCLNSIMSGNFLHSNTAVKPFLVTESSVLNLISKTVEIKGPWSPCPHSLLV